MSEARPKLADARLLIGGEWHNGVEQTDVLDKFHLTPINVNFVDQLDGNHVGVPQAKCNNCGDCCSGCNVGAKNTTLMNYIPDAWNHGAENVFGYSATEAIGKSMRMLIPPERASEERDILARVGRGQSVEQRCDREKIERGRVGAEGAAHQTTPEAKRFLGVAELEARSGGLIKNVLIAA